jgi:transmembrane sensor
LSNPNDTNERIEAEAAAWVVKLTSGRATADDVAQVRAWRTQSPAHDAAFVFARQTWRDLEALRGELPLAPPEFPTTRTLSPTAETGRSVMPALRLRSGQAPAGIQEVGARRSFLSSRTMAAVTILAAGLIIFFANPLHWLRADYRTGTGEIQQFTMPDGTVAHLNTHSALALHFGERERRVEVLSGEAVFTVAREESRPFVVEAYEVEARALGTRFIVRADSEQIQVTVLQHQVAVSTDKTLPGVVVNKGQTVRCDRSGLCGPVETAALNSATAWQRGKLIFDRVPLSTVVAELQRYRRGFIVVADDELAARTVSGVFRIDDLDAALDTIIAELKIQATRLPFLTVLH